MAGLVVAGGERGDLSATVGTVNCETDLDLNQHGGEHVTWRPHWRPLLVTTTLPVQLLSRARLTVAQPS